MLLDPLLFLKERRKDGYSNFEISWFPSNIWQGTFYSLCCHVGEPFPIHWLAAGDLQRCAVTFLTTWSFLRKQRIFKPPSFGSRCLCPQGPPPLIHLTKPILKHWLKRQLWTSVSQPPSHLISNRPAKRFLLPVFHLTLFKHWRRCYIGI